MSMYSGGYIGFGGTSYLGGTGTIGSTIGQPVFNSPVYNNGTAVPINTGTTVPNVR